MIGNRNSSQWSACNAAIKRERRGGPQDDVVFVAYCILVSLFSGRRPIGQGMSLIESARHIRRTAGC